MPAVPNGKLPGGESERMVVVSGSIYIRAPVERAFALMCDPAARSRLQPDVKPLQVEIEGGGPLAVGRSCRFRLEIEGRIVDYRTRVTEFEPNRLLLTMSDSAVPFETRIETRPESDGTRLTQTERFEPTDEMLIETAESETSRNFLSWLEPILPLVDVDYARSVRKRQELELTHELEEKLGRWLLAVKRELESPVTRTD
jgi:hypothetical protein